MQTAQHFARRESGWQHLVRTSARRFIPSPPLATSVLIGAIAAALGCVYSARQWARFDSPSWDLGIFTQLAKAYSTFSAPIVPIKGAGFNLLGDHFHPLLILLGPIYAVFPSGFTLLVVQNVLFGIAVAILTFAAIRHLSIAAGCSIGLAFAVSWGVQTAVEAQFHEVALAAPLMAMAMSAYLSGHWRSAALWIAPLVFVKEDLGITVAVFAGLLVWRTRDPRAVWLAVWGIGWTAFAIGIFLPLFNQNGHYDYSLVKGGEASDPLSLLVHGVFAPQKYETLGLLVLITVGIALRSRLVLLVLPTLAWRMLSSNESYWGTGWQYSVILMPILFAAAIDGVRSARRSSRRSARYFGTAAPFAILAVGLILLPFFPYRVLFSPPAPAADSQAQDSRSRAAAKVVALVPAGSSVETDITLLAYLVPKATVYWWGTPANPAPDIIALDLNSGSWTDDFRASSAAAFGEAHHPGVDYVEVFTGEGFDVAKRVR